MSEHLRELLRQAVPETQPVHLHDIEKRVRRARRSRAGLLAALASAAIAAVVVPLALTAHPGPTATLTTTTPSTSPPATSTAMSPSPTATSSQSSVQTSPTTGASPTSIPLEAVTTAPLQLANGAGEFYSPSENISCEIDYTPGAASNSAYCVTNSPPRSISISSTGTVIKSCTGPKCGSNAGAKTPTLSYGSATGVGPFRCLSLTSGVICTGSASGFMISTAGIVSCAGSTGTGTLTVCPGTGSVGTTVTVVGHGCSAGSVAFLPPGALGGSGGAAADILIAPGAGNDFAGTWTLPTTFPDSGDANGPVAVTPGPDYQFQTTGNRCHAPFRVTGSS